MRLRLSPAGEIRLVKPPGVFRGAFPSHESHDETAETCDSSHGVPGGLPEASTLVNKSEFETLVRLPRLTAFGNYARRRLKEAGAALQRSIAAPEEALFLTGTLPSVDVEAWRALAVCSGYVVHRLKAWIAKRLKSKLDFYVWEWQKRGALHLHYVVAAPDFEIRTKIKEGFHAQWIRLLQDVEAITGVSMFTGSHGRDWSEAPEKIRTEAAECRVDVSRYLSKYLSKGTNPKDAASLGRFCPTRWFGVSRPLSQRVRELTEEVEIVEENISDNVVYEELSSQIQRDCEVCYEYRGKVGEARVTLGYNDDIAESELIFNELKRRFLSVTKSKGEWELAADFRLHCADVVGHIVSEADEGNLEIDRGERLILERTIEVLNQFDCKTPGYQWTVIHCGLWEVTCLMNDLILSTGSQQIITLCRTVRHEALSVRRRVRPLAHAENLGRRV